jgi:hypothetical protein
MILYQLRGVTEPINFGLGSGVNTIGRAPGNSIEIPESSISGNHCEIIVEERGVFVRDLQSTNGTFINEQPVSEAWLEAGQTLQLGNLRFTLVQEQVAIAVPTAAKEQPEEPAAPATLPDGSLACAKFPHLPAAFRCTKCTKPYHGSALRQVRLHSGKMPLLFCPACDGKCEVIQGFSKAAKKDGGLLSRITQTIQLGWKRPKS